MRRKLIIKQIRHKTSIRVAVFLDNMGPYGERIMQAIVLFAKGRGDWRVDMASFGEVGLEEVAAGKVDGVIFGRWEPLASLLAAIKRGGIPAVDVSGGDAVDTTPGRVMPDDRAVGVMAAEHFLGRGFEHFAYYGLPEEFGHRWDICRRDGFRDTLSHRGFIVDCFNGSAHDWGELHDIRHLAMLSRWLVKLPKPVGVFACIDSFAYEVLRLARTAGIIAPEDFAVCGVDNRVWICMLASPSITSIPLDGVQAGVQSANMLSNMMDGKLAPAEPLMIPPRPLEQRESTNAYAFKDAEVVEALHYIRDHSHAPISVHDIMRSIPISRRSMEIRFKKVTGRTLQTEIWRTHLDKARHLLLETDQSMFDVAQNAGYLSSATFNVMFRRAIGMTPTEFRRRAKLPGQ